MNKFWNDVIDGIDDKYIDEAVKDCANNIPEEHTLTEIIVETPPPEKKSIRIIKTAAKIAAALAVVVGAGAVLKMNDISFSDLWAGRPSEITTTASVTTTISPAEITNIPDTSELTATTSVFEISHTTTISPAEMTTIPDKSESAVTYAITTTVPSVSDNIPEPLKIIAPAEDFHNNRNNEDYKAQIICRQGLSCYFRIGNMIFCYDINYEQISHAIDVMATLKQEVDIYTDAMTVAEYSNETERKLIISVKRKDNGVFDQYLIESGTSFGEYYLKYVPDMSVYNGYEKDKGLIESKNAFDPFIAQDIRDSERFAYLTGDGNEIYDLCINIEDSPTYDTTKLYPFGEYRPIESVEDENVTKTAISVNHIIDEADLSAFKSFDYINNPPVVVHASSDSCMFTLNNKLFECTYTGTYKKPNTVTCKSYDITETLKKYYNLYYDEIMGITVYATAEDWFIGENTRLILLTLQRKNSDIADYYAIDYSVDKNKICYFNDWEKLEKYYEYNVTIPSGYADALGATMGFRQGSSQYVYLRDSGLDYLEGIERLEVVWRTGNNITEKGLPFGKYKEEEKEENEDDIIPEEEQNPVGPAQQQYDFMLDGKEYWYNLWDYSFIIDADGNFIESTLDNCDYYILKDGTISETLDNINQLEEVFPEDINENHKGNRFFRYGCDNGIISVRIGSETSISINVDGTEKLVDCHYCSAWLHYEREASVTEKIFDAVIDEREYMFDIDFLNLRQSNSFNYAFGMLSGLYLNQDMPDDKKLSNGYYLTKRNFYHCDFYFRNIFSDDELNQKLYKMYNFLNINGCIAWKPYKVNTKYKTYTNIVFELVKSTETSIEFKAIVSFGAVTEEFTYRMVCTNGHNWDMEYFECWDGTVLTSADSE